MSGICHSASSNLSSSSSSSSSSFSKSSETYTIEAIPSMSYQKSDPAAAAVQVLERMEQQQRRQQQNQPQYQVDTDNFHNKQRSSVGLTNNGLTKGRTKSSPLMNRFNIMWRATKEFLMGHDDIDDDDNNNLKNRGPKISSSLSFVEVPQKTPNQEEEEEEATFSSSLLHNSSEPPPPQPPSSSPSPSSLSLIVFLLNLTGSLAFCAGSVLFLQSVWGDPNQSFPPFQLGCTIWMIGCLFFMIPLTLLLMVSSSCQDEAKQQQQQQKQQNNCFPWMVVVRSVSLLSRWTFSQGAEMVCLICFLVGCALGGLVPSEDQVLGFFPVINCLFLLGSCILMIHPLLALLQYVATSCCCCVTTSNGYTSSDRNNNNDTDTDDDDDVNLSTKSCCCCCSHHCCIQAEAWSTEWYMEMIISSSFVFAGSLGGYATQPAYIQAGVCGWAVGSVFSLLYTLRAFYMECQEEKERDKPQCRPKEKQGDEENYCLEQNDDSGIVELPYQDV